MTKFIDTNPFYAALHRPMNSIPPIPTTADASDAAPLSFEFPSFVPRAPWWGADLQTVRSVLLGQTYGLEDFPEKRLRFWMRDSTGDVLHGILNQPVEPGALPLVALVHGLTGCAESHCGPAPLSYCAAGCP